MKKLHFGLVSIVLLLSSVTSCLASDNLVQTVAKGCQKEIETFCKDVTPGQGRILACLYAHNDKLSESSGYGFADRGKP